MDTECILLHIVKRFSYKQPIEIDRKQEFIIAIRISTFKSYVRSVVFQLNFKKTVSQISEL